MWYLILRQQFKSLVNILIRLKINTLKTRIIVGFIALHINNRIKICLRCLRNNARIHLEKNMSYFLPGIETRKLFSVGQQAFEKKITNEKLQFKQ